MSTVSNSWRGFQRAFNYMFISISILITGCVYDPTYYGPPAYSEFRPHYYDYYYYPSVRVYFHFTSGYYYYRDRDRWVKTLVLPRHVHIDSKDRVRIRIDAKKPFIKHKEHIRIYKPKPDYRVKKERNLKERDANRRWHEDYKKKRVKPDKKKKDKKKDKKK